MLLGSCISVSCHRGKKTALLENKDTLLHDPFTQDRANCDHNNQQIINYKSQKEYVF